MAKQKFYVVWVGAKPGIYDNWAECQKQVNGFHEAKYKSFDSQEQATMAFKAGWKKHWGNQKVPKQNQKQPASLDLQGEIDYDSISVDVGTRGNPGPIEYKGVDTKTGEVVFYVGPIENGTNNLGEFIAIVHALAYLKEKGSHKTIYTDSRTALSWIRNKKTATTLPRNPSTEKIWELTDRAVKWLHTHSYENKILKWNTEAWGEIKADFGRK